MNWWLLSIFLAGAYNPDVPHAHSGILTPITEAPSPISISEAEKAKLLKGEVVLQQQQNGEQGGRGVAVQYINANEGDVWMTILSYHKYKDWVDNVVSCEVYDRKDKDIYIEMISSILGVKVGFYTKNSLRKPEKYMSWTLDYRKESDVNDMIGYWRVEQIQDAPPITRVDYSTEMKVSGVPKFVANYLTKDALSSGTKWVKEQAEKR
jgi:hypothetical protein